MTAVAIAGAAGRMGRTLVRLALEGGLTVCGATEAPGAPALGADAGVLAGGAAIGVALTEDAGAAAAGAAVWIDFTTPEAALAALPRLPAGTAAVIGATGFDAAQDAAVAAAAGTRAIVKAGNFSLGAALLAALVRQAARRLGPAWDIEIIETHHRDKRDAPSGTALMLGRAAAAGRGADLADLRLPPHDGIGPARPAGGIGFAAVRGGTIIGRHEVVLAGPGETLRLSHEAEDRALFAHGALTAARWAIGRPPGLYGIDDVLGL